MSTRHGAIYFAFDDKTQLWTAGDRDGHLAFEIQAERLADAIDGILYHLIDRGFIHDEPSEIPDGLKLSHRHDSLPTHLH